MVVVASGPLSLTAVANEFGDSVEPYSMAAMYRGGSYVLPGYFNNGIPTSGSVPLTAFYNTRKTRQYVVESVLAGGTVSYGAGSNPGSDAMVNSAAIVIPRYATDITFEVMIRNFGDDVSYWSGYLVATVLNSGERIGPTDGGGSQCAKKNLGQQSILTQGDGYGSGFRSIPNVGSGLNTVDASRSIWLQLSLYQPSSWVTGRVAANSVFRITYYADA